MSLKARTGLIVFCFVAVIVAGLVLAGQLREALLRDQLSRTATAGSSALWSKIVEAGVQRMRGRISIVEDDLLLRTALQSGDRGRIATAARDVLEALQATGDVMRLDLVAPSREVLYSSVPAFEPAAAASEDALARMLEEGWRGNGVAIDAERNVTLSLGVPLIGYTGSILAVAIYATDIAHALGELKAGTGAEALIVNRRGRLLVGTNPEVWDEVRAEALLSEGATQLLSGGEQVFSLAVLPLEAELGNLAASLVTVQDVSAAYAEQRRVGFITLLAIGGFLLVSLVGLWLYLHRALSPLSDGVHVLHALARGDTRATVRVSGEEGEDELAQIARAVNTFRTQTLALRRHRRRASRRRRQQERFIRDEMTRLAATLNEEVRRDILADLADLEAPPETVQDGTDGPEDEVNQGDLQMMGLAFQKMTSRVARQQDRLTALVAELQEALRTRTAYLALQRDLQLATRVQRSFLPGERFSAPGIEIHATMHTAKEVGGDFYDFFALDEHRVGIVIGDVVGKGVPASLFMAVTRTVIRATAQHLEESPGQCLRVVNDTLVDATREDVFVTVFYGVYDRRDGSLVYSNGGHNPPVLVTPGRADLLPLTGGVALAMFDGLSYDESRVEVPPGGKLFLYTDGVTESVSTREDEFGDERMKENLLASAGRGPGDTIEEMLRAVEGFAGTAPQFDDIAMLVLGRDTPEDTIIVRRFSLRNDRTEIPRLAREIEAFAEAGGIDPADVGHLQLALEEAITNTMDYGLPVGGVYEIDVRATVEDGLVEVAVEDDGVAYDPMVETPEFDPDQSMEERRIGGIGVHLVRTLMDEVNYLRVGDRNRLTVRKRIAS